MEWNALFGKIDKKNNNNSCFCDITLFLKVESKRKKAFKAVISLAASQLGQSIGGRS